MTNKISWKKVPINKSEILAPSPIPKNKIVNGIKAGTGKYLIKSI